MQKPKELLAHPHHAMIWFWVGIMALITPIGFFLCGPWIKRNTKDHEAV